LNNEYYTSSHQRCQHVPANHGLCGSNKLFLYKRCAKSMKSQNFDYHVQLPHFSTDFNEIQNQDSTCKIWLMWDDGRAFSVTFCVLYPERGR